MKTRLLILLPALLLTVACGGSSGAATSNSPAVQPSASEPRPLPSNDQILALVYDNAYSVPADFYVDERASMQRSYSLYHVKDPSLSYELCSDDFTTAQAWEDADNASRSVSGYYVGEYENERYFEFIRELSFEDDVGNIEDLTSPGFARVFKCSNTNRDGVDRSLLNGYAGRLNMRPLASGHLQTFTEYMWQFTFFPYNRKKVLESYAGHGQQTIEHTLLLAFGINQGSGNCDLIEVSKWQFSADRATGELSKQFMLVHSFEAQLRDGKPEICD